MSDGRSSRHYVDRATSRKFRRSLRIRPRSRWNVRSSGVKFERLFEAIIVGGSEQGKIIGGLLVQFHAENTACLVDKMTTVASVNGMT